MAEPDYTQSFQLLSQSLGRIEATLVTKADKGDIDRIDKRVEHVEGEVDQLKLDQAADAATRATEAGVHNRRYKWWAGVAAGISAIAIALELPYYVVHLHI